YRNAHTKTTIGIAHVDTAARTLRYFHNAGFFELSGDDFDGVLRPAISHQAGYLPPFCEILKSERVVVRGEAELRAIALELRRKPVERRPSQNPLAAYGTSFPEHVEKIASGGMPAYHAYSFAGLRQLGAAFELAGAHLRWLDSGSDGFESAAAPFERIANGA